MIQDLTKIYEGADLSGATPDVIYLPILRDGTLKSVDVMTDAAQSGAAVFSVEKNGSVISGLSALTIANGAKIGSNSTLAFSVVKGDEIVLNLVSGNVSSPIALNLSVLEDSEDEGNVFSIDAAPSDLNERSDYFAGNTLNSKWTRFQEQLSTLIVKDGLARFTMPAGDGTSVQRLNGIFQSLPSGDCSIIAKVWNKSLTAASFSAFGIGLFEDAANNPNTTNILLGSITRGVSSAAADLARYNDFQNYGTFVGNSALTIEDPAFTPFIYLRFSRSGTTWNLHYSRRGYVWTSVSSITESTLGYSPAQFGIICENSDDQPENSFFCELVQFSNTAADNLKGGIVGGQMVGLTGEDYSFFDVDAPNAEPTEYDDNFDKAQIGAQWTAHQLSTIIPDFETIPLHLRLSPIDAFTRGYAQNVPSGNWKFRVKVSVEYSGITVGATAAELLAGISIHDGTIYENYCLMNHSEDGHGLRAEKWSNHTSFNQQRDLKTITVIERGKSIYLEVAWDGTNLVYSHSYNGIEFFRQISFAPSITPTKVILFVRGNGEGIGKKATFKWFKKVPANNITGGKTTLRGSRDASLGSFNVDRKPANVFGKSDYFEKPTLDSKWTRFQGSYSTLSIDRGALKLVMPSQASDRTNGVFQSLPSGDCTIITKVFTDIAKANFSAVGIGLFADAAANPNTSNFIFLRLLGINTAYNVEVSHFDDFDTFLALVDSGAYTAGADSHITANRFVYLRYSRSGTTWTASYSLNGFNWTTITTFTEASFFAPSQFGLLVANLLHGNTNNFFFDFIKYVNAANATLLD